MKAGAPKGNKNAEKWTKEQAQGFIDRILQEVETDTNCTSIEKAAVKIGWYESLLVYLENKFQDIDLMPIKKSKAIIKSRLIEKGLKNEYNPTMTIFILKNNHDMKDKQEVDQNVNVNEIPPLKWFKND